mmetsp:Transcript_29023/g.42819  ORF Transcript_29023/g.42819 Transcript_29023/m.42819 type:complete len:498 (+) Transcript_29023:106-1599(+)|eukprot:CAMPEP_0194200398 /NCGR_PEP_ID=MMETSP0156-20130528/1017_1 /TAXON_ID=33649 /ORGANISM="Thalassionema nitzschioides, Strain L26-B" /LENGTH=497 /DNA_ID=CAMNT_0038925385 /DNA_START=92 /DNA_END=1585 /DNA_ORIENTATION=+
MFVRQSLRSSVISGASRRVSSRWFSSAVSADLPDDVVPEKQLPSKTIEEDDFEKNLRPSDVVKELDRHIVGQADAKRAVAIAMRNRWRRRQLPEELRTEVTPRNVLMIGPTGCGKTEVARRMAALGGAPFLKVEATKFTEVGYHGRDVDQIIRDLMDVSMALTKKKQTEMLRGQAKELVEDRILDLLTGPKKEGSRGRDSFRDMYRQNLLDDHEVEVDVPEGGAGADRNNVFAAGDNSNPNIQAMTDFLSRMGNGQGKKVPKERKKMPISEAKEVILEMELDKLLENIDIKKLAITAVEESGIVFIDEIDKICSSRDVMSRSADASAEGVQRDLLPLIEGTTINTKYGNVKTDYILFVASGAFHAVKPSDMLPELQGRLPIRVELNGLTEDDLYKILTEPVANLVRQQVELIKTEGVTLEFTDESIREMARLAALLNKTVENIGARRLHTVIERIMEDLSFEAAEQEKGACLKVEKELVQERLTDAMTTSDMSKYIL